MIPVEPASYGALSTGVSVVLTGNAVMKPVDAESHGIPWTGMLVVLIGSGVFMLADLEPNGTPFLRERAVVSSSAFEVCIGLLLHGVGSFTISAVLTTGSAVIISVGLVSHGVALVETDSVLFDNAGGVSFVCLNCGRLCRANRRLLARTGSVLRPGPLLGSC
jgi:hypothetical protein